jgi:hypothetical protein
MHIPTRGEYTSFNLAHAVSIVLYTLSRAGQAPLSYLSPSAIATATTRVTPSDTKTSINNDNANNNNNNDDNNDDNDDNDVDDLTLGFDLLDTPSSTSISTSPNIASSSVAPSIAAVASSSSDTISASPSLMSSSTSSNRTPVGRGGRRARLKRERQGVPAEAASRAHVDALRRYFVGTADRFQLSKTEPQRAHFEKVTLRHLRFACMLVASSCYDDGT